MPACSEPVYTRPPTAEGFSTFTRSSFVPGFAAALNVSTAACRASVASVTICWDSRLEPATAEAFAMASLNDCRASLVTHVPSLLTSEPSTETVTPSASFLASATAEVSEDVSTALEVLTVE